MSTPACLLMQRDPLPYAPKDNVSELFRGKQMGTVPAKLGRLPKTYFEKELKLLFQDLPYVDRLMYAQLQPEKPAKGFHTSDYSRRDEFTMTFRTDQYRDLLKVGAFYCHTAHDTPTVVMQWPGCLRSRIPCWHAFTHYR